MKLKTNPRNRICNWIITVNLVCWLVSQSGAKPARPTNAAGPIIGVTCLVICGVVIYTLIYTCKKCFGTTNTNNAVPWGIGSCPPILTSTCPDVPCDDTNPPSLLSKFSDAQWIVLERSTNNVHWDAIDAKWENLNTVEFQDNYPPQPAFYRFLLEY